MKHNKMVTLSELLEQIKIENTDFQIKHTSKNENGNITNETDYYPQNKAIVDLFKTYSNAVTDL